jgi:cyclic pyranopterin phosphate synthase
MSELTHYDADGTARMVDVSGKPPLAREAIAEAFLIAAEGTIDRILTGSLPKGEALAVARIAGIQAAKRCAELIPLCHPLPLNHAGVDFERTAVDRLRISATTRTIDRTGVEMEALCAASIAALTLWDMVKGVDADLRITDVTLVSKTKQEPAT